MLYKSGDKLHYVNAGGWEIEVLEVDNFSMEYVYCVLETPDGFEHLKGRVERETAPLLEKEWKRASGLETPRKPLDCTCDAYDLLRKGCACGYAKAQGKRWGLGT